MAWHAKRNGGRDLPSPAVIGDFVIVTAMGGVTTCYDAKTGKTHWVDRLEGAFSGSPLISQRALLYSKRSRCYLCSSAKQEST
jgi:outer membrane protein assembly factor BamB